MNTQMRITKITGSIALFASLLCFFCIMIGLKNIFGYPEIIRQEPSVIMEKLYQTRLIVPYLYYFGIGVTGVCIAIFSILFAKILKSHGDDIWSSLGKTCGIISGVLLYAGILRYSILFPQLSIMRHNQMYDPKTIDLIFNSMNTYIGVTLAEHVQFTFTALMFFFFGMSIRKTKLMNKYMVYYSFLAMIVTLIGNLEPFGFSFAFAFNRTAAKLLILWLFLSGIFLIIQKEKTVLSKTNTIDKQ